MSELFLIAELTKAQSVYFAWNQECHIHIPVPTSETKTEHNVQWRKVLKVHNSQKKLLTSGWNRDINQLPSQQITNSLKQIFH